MSVLALFHGQGLKLSITVRSTKMKLDTACFGTGFFVFSAEDME